MRGETAISGAGASSARDAQVVGPTYRPPETEPRRRTLFAQALVDTFSQPGARLGAVWIGVVIVLAIFAPFLASSFPLAMKRTGGGWEFPLFANLHPIDVLLVVIFLTVAVLAVVRPVGLGKSLLAVAIVTAVATPVCFWVTDPPRSVVWEQYREMAARGEIEKAYYTIIPYSANDRMRDRPQEVRKPPSSAHWLGTTIFGEDMLSRMIHACRVALTIGIIATSISVIIGIIIGGLMGYFAGWVDLLGMRLIEIVQAIPGLILLLIITAFFGKSLYLMMVVIGLISWTANARFIRAEFLKLRKLDFVQAGIAAGLPLRSILFRHMLPNGVAPVLVNASFGIAGAILLESTLSFLGLGLEAKDPSWGQLLNQARAGGTGFNWWIAVFPGAAIFLTVFSYILIGEAARDAIDPKLRKMRD
ncbi:MAG: ABC transporter permease [Phycisphaerales bacterium]|nr:ABC transporter permease [Phycisphaerales bacterium]